MIKGKNLKNLGLALMIFGLIFMVVAWIKMDDINYVAGGSLIVSLGGLLDHYGRKQDLEN